MASLCTGMDLSEAEGEPFHLQVAPSPQVSVALRGDRLNTFERPYLEPLLWAVLSMSGELFSPSSQGCSHPLGALDLLVMGASCLDDATVVVHFGTRHVS